MTASIATWLRRVVSALALSLAACSGFVGGSFQPSLPPFVQGERRVEAVEMAALTEPVDPLRVTPAMRAFSERYLKPIPASRQRLLLLQRLLFSPDGLALRYDGHSTLSAGEAFEDRSVNCLSFSHLFIALARDAGLNAHYQLVELKPDWQRRDGWVLVLQHVNVSGRLGREGYYVADVDRQQRSRQTGSRRMSDAEALAHHYNNLAMNALLDGNLPIAYSYLVRALQSEDRAAFIWVNLGTVLFHNDQQLDARLAFQYALDLEPQSVLAMRKFVTTLQDREHTELAEYYRQKIARNEQSNPYYFAALAQRNVVEDNWQQAWGHIERALKLKPDDTEFYPLAIRASLETGHQKRAQALRKKLSNLLERGEGKRQDNDAARALLSGEPWPSPNVLNKTTFENQNDY